MEGGREAGKEGEREGEREFGVALCASVVGHCVSQPAL